MKPGDLIEWNWGDHRKRGMVIRKSSLYGWVVYFSKTNRYENLSASSLRKLQEIE